MVYSDGVHLIADSLAELHLFAKKAGIKRCYYHGVRKGHPHYDIPVGLLSKVIDNQVVLITTREIIIKIQEIRQSVK